MSDKLKVGIIGLGGITRTHIPGWVASEYTEVAAGCDINEALFPEWGTPHGVTALCTDPMEPSS